MSMERVFLRWCTRNLRVCEDSSLQPSMISMECLSLSWNRETKQMIWWPATFAITLLNLRRFEPIVEFVEVPGDWRNVDLSQCLLHSISTRLKILLAFAKSSVISDMLSSRHFIYLHIWRKSKNSSELYRLSHDWRLANLHPFHSHPISPNLSLGWLTVLLKMREVLQLIGIFNRESGLCFMIINVCHALSEYHTSLYPSLLLVKIDCSLRSCHVIKLIFW